jgi:hypothetical protein
MDDVNLYVIWRSLTSKSVATSPPRTNPNPSLDLREFDGFMPGSEADLLRRAAGSGTIKQQHFEQWEEPKQESRFHCSEKQITSFP